MSTLKSRRGDSRSGSTTYRSGPTVSTSGSTPRRPGNHDHRPNAVLPCDSHRPSKGSSLLPDNRVPSHLMSVEGRDQRPGGRQRVHAFDLDLARVVLDDDPSDVVVVVRLDLE